MVSRVYFGSPQQSKLDASETLPAKLDLILDQLHIRDRVKDEQVCIKVHVGNNIGYSVIHPVFIRKVVQAVKDGGGRPFVTDISWDVRNCASRGYTEETLGCPIYPAGGPDDQYFYAYDRPFKNIQTWKLAGMVHDASFLINFAHIKGHPCTGFGGAFKNLALGCMIQETRGQMHDTNHFYRYWIKEKCPDKSMMQKIIDSCPFGAIVFDGKDPSEFHLHVDPCNQCMRCQKVAPAGSLKIMPETFEVFQEACAISTDIAMSTFAPGKAVHLALANQMTPVCDCFGFTGLPILPDAGIFGSDDIVALDQAVLDATARTPLIEENVPNCMEVQHNGGHPFAQLHGEFKNPYKVVQYGEALGLGSTQYELDDVQPVQPRPARSEAVYVALK